MALTKTNALSQREALLDLWTKAKEREIEAARERVEIEEKILKLTEGKVEGTVSLHYLDDEDITITFGMDRKIKDMDKFKKELDRRGKSDIYTESIVLKIKPESFRSLESNSSMFVKNMVDSGVIEYKPKKPSFSKVKRARK